MAAAQTNIHGDRALLYLPQVISEEEDDLLHRVGVEALSIPERLAISLLLFRARETQPNLLFYPTPWMKLLLTTKVEGEMAATPATPAEEEEEEDDALDDEGDDEGDGEQEEM